ncbi:cytochrome c oxidase assembly protein [Nocardioides daphniae]|uniref:ABC transporter permease n=1 Tax=Nocardioides daphniae TaxID=402297 RepID=A0A4P7U8X3_9ACTN|nr:cytochrome c oxidase assembly protein [Nocardioides daphniae]QCC76081.1 cytochrome c oxidase assembly protein [Nocardioides daphniae]GGD10391.1 ABC transporter permease [Nocardioides daphniae]
MTVSPAAGAASVARLGRVLVPAVLVVVAPTTAIVLLTLTGGLSSTALPGLPVAGTVTRWGLPVMTALRDASAAVTVGVLVLAAVCVPGRIASDALSLPQELLRRVAVVAAVSWAAGGTAVLLFAYSDAAGKAVGSTGFWAEAWFFATQLEAGRPLLSGPAMAWAVVLTCVVLRRTSGLGFAALLALASLWPLALGGHSAGTLDHNVLVDLQLYHLVGLTVWTGGLVGLLVVRRRVGSALPAVARRYSRLAGWCLVVVAGSGVAGALIRLPGLWAIESRYGVLLLVKVLVLAAVALLGLWQRTRALDRVSAGESGGFVRLVGIEVLLLLAGAGAGVALARTGPPGPTEDPSLNAAQVLLGRELPPPLGVVEWFSQWRPDLLWLPLAAGMCVGYIAGVLRLRERGVRWPVLRMASWAVGWTLVAWATAGAPGVYGPVLLSMHMVQHVTMTVAVPILLVLARPVTLALEVLEPRADGSSGPREWLVEALRSFLGVVATTPVVATGLLLAGFPLLYFTGVLRLSLESHTVHQMVAVYFLVCGYLFANAVIGRDPYFPRPPVRTRVLLLLAALALHAWFSISLLSADQALAGDWFRALQRQWGPSLAADQQVAASLGWVLGELPLAILVGVVGVQWATAHRHGRPHSGLVPGPAPLSDRATGAPQEPADREHDDQGQLKSLEPGSRGDRLGERNIRDHD